MLGLLNVHKPTSPTSRDVVNHVQRLVRPAKVGHAGTLDPLAAGVLVVCIGAATRLIEYIQRMRKCYVAEFRLGCFSDTDDREGNVVDLPSAPYPSRAELESAIAPLVGEIQQRPPAYSAIKVQGKRAYALARRGTLVELPPRPVMVYAIAIQSYEYPLLTLKIQCGSGTYIRALGRDLANSLGTSAVMTALTRTAIGCFAGEDSVTLASLTRETIGPRLIPPIRALAGRPVVTLDEEQIRRVVNGQFLRYSDHGHEGPVAAVDEANQLIAVLRAHDRDHLRPAVVFATR